MNKISNLYKNKDSRKKLLVLFACLGIFKLGMHVYVPGINREVLQGMTQDNGIFSMMNTFTGGAFSTYSIFAIGIMPYITASIIVQLLQMDVMPTLTEWKNQGEYGQRKLKRLTYVLTIVFAMFQGAAMSYGFNKMYAGLVKNPGILSFLLITVVLTLGTAILVILGEIIEHKGIGKGISMIILSGILMTLPDNLTMYFSSEFTNVGDTLFLSIIKTVLLILFVYFLLLTVIVINGGERKIPIQSSYIGQYGKMSVNKNYLPIKINVAGVIPVIFASALFMLPVTIAQFFGEGKITGFINSYLSFKSVSGIFIYALLIVMFSYFYTFIQMDPAKVAEDLHKGNSFIPSIRPGKETENYFRNVLLRLTFVGSLFLALIAALPMMLGKVIILPEQLVMSGASLIIIVSVIVELFTQLQVEMTKTKYQSFKKNTSYKGFLSRASDV